ncbi:MAG TPA: fructose 1,6-bisphosphatase [Planctomycetota bacterium]|nr:fructose 1,6-bisphosphatase [Planctomycetota bacterium]
MEKITLTIVKAGVGGYIGHATCHEDVQEKAREFLGKASSKGVLVDSWVGSVGDDLILLLSHEKGVDSKDIHRLAWDGLTACAEVAEKLKLHNPAKDLFTDAFPGHLKGTGPVFAEVSFRERPSEPFILFAADKCGVGTWNLPLYRTFADPFNTPGLVIDPSMHEGFAFEILDTLENKTITLQCPGDLYDLIMFLGSSSRFAAYKVIRRVDGLVAAIGSGPRPPGTGRTAGTDDPFLLVRCQTGLPAVGEILEAFSFPHLVTGWMRGTHVGPILPVAFEDAGAIRFDGPPRVIAAGFVLANGEFEGPVDLFADPAFDGVRKKSLEVADYLRRHGPFEPHRVPHDQMGNTPFHPMLSRLDPRMVRNDDPKKKRKQAVASEESTSG